MYSCRQKDGKSNCYSCMSASGSYLRIVFRLVSYYAGVKNWLIKVEYCRPVLYDESALKAFSVFGYKSVDFICLALAEQASYLIYRNTFLTYINSDSEAAALAISHAAVA